MILFSKSVDITLLLWNIADDTDAGLHLKITTAYTELWVCHPTNIWLLRFKCKVCIKDILNTGRVQFAN